MTEKKIEEFLREKGGELPIPEEVSPRRMEQVLRAQRKRGLQKFFRYASWAAAACFFLIVGILLDIQKRAFFPEEAGSVQMGKRQEIRENQTFAEASEEEQELLDLPDQTYEEIYACLSEHWKAQDALSRGGVKEEMGLFREAEDLADAEQKLAASPEAFGQTNQQVQTVDEADRIKNDGRYLYQIARKAIKKENESESIQTGIQILDTKDGLKETAFLTGLEGLEEFYLWKDRLITIQNKYYGLPCAEPAAKKGAYVEDMAFLEQGYHEISIYQVTDKSRPRKEKTFTLQGTYESSRVSDGYFYGISRFTARPGSGEQDYDAYIPSVDGKRMEADRIYCPPEAGGSDYLVLVSIDLSDPSALADSRALLAGSGTYYVNESHIYAAWYQSVYEQEPQREGTIQDRTRLLKFSYQKGRFYAQAEGEIPGRLNNSFSMDEYQGNLRAAVTVQEYQAKEVIDDRTGERIGFDYGESAQSNALYILNPSLELEGKVEGLAKGETIRSARFFGETGYLVTFRQTDPLFAVDLSDPEHPEVLGELKVSGFSEYLHIYGENRLLGIGMEADEETGVQQGMKLSMFDISDPTELKEVSRLPLVKYHYSEALYEHRAVLIDTEENIIGFEAEGSDRGEFWKDYLLFSYEEEGFAETLKIETRRGEDDYCRTRGTFIGDTFYLLFEDGAARAYDRETGALKEELSL